MHRISDLSEWVIGNEFAQVRLRLDRAGHDPRLEIVDLATGRTILLDAITLAQIARSSEEAIRHVMDPGREGQGSALDPPKAEPLSS